MRRYLVQDPIEPLRLWPDGVLRPPFPGKPATLFRDRRHARQALVATERYFAEVGLTMPGPLSIFPVED